jgi:hypothetical protein
VQVSDTESWSVETLHHKNAEMSEKTPFGAGFGYWELECRNTSPQECLPNAEMKKHLLV